MSTTTTTPAAPLLRVDSLRVAYGRTQVVHDVGFSLRAGESLALIGESGSGKSTIARAVLRLLPRAGASAQGTVELEGADVLGVPESRFRPLRGRRIGFVPQDPANSFNPVRTIGAQALEAAALLDEPDHEARRERILDVFERVGLPDPDRVYRAYPHELSGGMLQRALIGLAVLPSPALLVADEPTSALDVTIQRRILDLLSELRDTLGLGLLLITHDLAIAAERTDEVVVLKDGRVQEAGRTAEVFANPRSDYTRRLQADAPALNPEQYASRRAVVRERVAADAAAAGDETAERETARPDVPRIEVSGVTKRFSDDPDVPPALEDVSFRVAAGTTHALVGESGSGKTTAIRVLLGLESADEGEIRIDGERVDGRGDADLRDVRRQLQLVYQNPFTSLDPTWRVERIVREPLDRYRVGSRAERRARVAEALDAVGLAEALRSRRPAALSGGRRQRVAIARALVLHPRIAVLDEPTSALDVSVQADIFDVLANLQTELGLTYLFVSHDLALVRQIADTVSVLRAGRVIEEGPVERVLSHPEQDYTRALIAAIPSPEASLVRAAATEARAVPVGEPELAHTSSTDHTTPTGHTTSSDRTHGKARA
ncbi:ABC transporter ATP-binding protein [Pseudoclavibacter chungangensis]|uniref:ABC transporter ATP-binding protein n=1 Tax=Pseudoclavibacter chungangensis TaxID=587635 RepID=A0A7J5BNR2_9MICO|nr:ABC transporter ATP-binding protein [Pseudoclavibacter chungangensis]KAB1653823.1 ABC transporter ATP-binding protein [Pseudoclavibacter chungangensis]NYJ68167.1 peptide/nickel transport system ATP-binding protein [Pseudoclavibacter chungangensis]